MALRALKGGESMRFRLFEAEDKVSEMELVTDDTVAEVDDDMELVLSGWWVYIPDLNISLRQGTVCIWDEEEKIFMPDFDVTVVYEGNVTESEWLYYEQDGFVMTLANWLNGRLDMEILEQLWCELIVEN